MELLKGHELVEALNAWDLYDMAGNILEWTHDWFQHDLGSASITNPVGASTGTEHVFRGGAAYTDPQYVRASYRFKITEDGGPNIGWLGFRCVRTN